MKNTKKLFTTTCILFVLFAMLTNCTTVPRNPQPLRAAAVSSTSDAYSGWYDIKFCTRISGTECVDYTTVRLYPDGMLVWVDAPPQTTVSKMFSKTKSISGCDTFAEQSACDIRTNIEQAWSTKDENGYRFSEQKCI